MDQHRDFELQAGAEDGGRPDVVLTLSGRGKLVIDAKFPLDEFRGRRAGRAGAAPVPGDPRPFRPAAALQEARMAASR